MGTTENQDTSDRQEPPRAFLLCAEDAARFLGISLRHLYKLHSSGRLPLPVRLGRAVRWPREELAAWIAAGAPNRIRWEALVKQATYRRHDTVGPHRGRR